MFYLGPYLSITSEKRLHVPDTLSSLVSAVAGPAADGAQVWVANTPLPGSAVVYPDTGVQVVSTGATLVEESMSEAVRQWQPVLHHLERLPGVKFSLGYGLVANA